MQVIFLKYLKGAYGSAIDAVVVGVKISAGICKSGDCEVN